MPSKYIRKTSDDITVRFLSNFNQISDSCWEWRGAKNQHGYGRLNFKKKIYPAHRYSYEYFKGNIPNNMYVLHHCDNRKCVNPDHLFLGTLTDNYMDCVNKDRHVIGRKGVTPDHLQGERHPNSRLTESIVLEIKDKLNQGARNRDIVNEYNIGANHVTRIKNEQTWRYLLCR